MRARGGRAVILTGIAVGIVLVLGFLYWKDFLVRYHLTRLRTDPARLRAAMLELEGSAAHLAVGLFLQTEEGKDRLARAYFDACDAWIQDAHVFDGGLRIGWPARTSTPAKPGSKTPVFSRGGWERKGTVIFQVEGELCVGRVEGPGGSGELRDNERDRFIRSCAPFLGPLRGRSFQPEKNRGFQVSFVPGDEAGFRTGRYLWVTGGATSMYHVKSGSGPSAGFPTEALAAMKAATALLVEPVATSP